MEEYSLKKHEHDEELETVQSWRDAITDLDCTVGWRYTATNSKTDLIQRLVEEISTILNRVDEKKESSMNQQANMSAEEENTQVVAVLEEECPVSTGESSSAYAAEVDTELIEEEEEEIRGELVDVEKLELEEKEETRCNDEQQQADESFAHTTNGEGVYRVITSAYFQKSRWEMKGKVINIKPMWSLRFYVEPNKESSSCLLLTNTTDNYVAFKIHYTTTDQTLKYRVCPIEGLLLPCSTCQVIVTMEAQSILPPDLECSDKIFVQSVITKKDSYSMDDFSDMFKEESGTPIHKHEMRVNYFTSYKRHSSIIDHHAQLANKGLVHGSEKVRSIDTHSKKPWVLLCCWEKIICIWNYETGAEEKLFEVYPVEFVACGKFVYEKHWIVVGLTNGIVRVYDYNTLENVIEFKAHEEMIGCVAVHPTLPYVLTSSMDKLVKLWNWKSEWACIETFEGHSKHVAQVVFNPNDSTSFTSVSWDGTIKIWNFDSSVAKFTINAQDTLLTCVEYFVGNNDKLYILSGSSYKSVRVWDYESKTLIRSLEGHLKDVTSAFNHPELPIIITGSEDKTIRIWNKKTFRLELVWTCDLGEVRSIGYIKATNKVVLGCEDGMMVIKIVDAGTLSD